jgi:carbonic anhydrase
MPWKSLSDGRRRVCNVLPKGDSGKSILKAKKSAEAADAERLSIRNRNENRPCSSELRQNPPYTRGDRKPGRRSIAAKGQGVIFIRRRRTERAASSVLPGRMVNCSFIGNLACSASSLALWAAAIIFIVSAVWATPMIAQEHGVEHWSYDGETGPSHWGDLSPEFAPCKTGHHQSPINIGLTQKDNLPALQFDYKTAPLHIIDNGHTIMINYAPGSSLRVGDKRYELKQFHFHRPSEEKINGKGYDMAVHLVHVAQDGSVAVVAVMLQRGRDNPLIDELWDDLPREKGKEQLLDSVQINVANLLPADRGYYTFSGSLTTPPCTENVTWYVLKQPVTISVAEIREFSKLYRDDARPTQPLYDRVVEESK